MIKLHDYWRSSASYRVRIALAIAGLNYQSLPVDLVSGAQFAPEHLALHPLGLVPVLEINDEVLMQSLAIIEYLEEKFALGLLPQDLLSRAKVSALAYAVAMDIHPVCNPRVAKYAIANSNGVISMESWMREFIAPGLAALEQMVADGDFCFANSVTIADICLVPQIYNARRWGVDLSQLPKLRRISTHLETPPAFAAAHPDGSKPQTS